MNMPEFLTSPPPATGWSLDTAVAAVVRRQAKTGLSCAAVDIPEGTFEIGPVGLQSVDEDKLRPVLTRLQQEVEGSSRAAVVVPTGWLRTHLFEFDDLPRRRADIDDLVMWRLKKLLPVSPSSLRVASVVQPPDGGARRLTVLVGVEHALASLESVFAAVDVSPGVITPRVFAAIEGAEKPSPLLSIQQEDGFLSILLLVNDQPRLVRTKPLAGHGWAVVERELGLTVSFIRTTLEVEGAMTVTTSIEDAGIGEHLKQWITSHDLLTEAAAAPPSLAFDGTAIRDRAGAHRLDPVVNVISGGIR